MSALLEADPRPGRGLQSRLFEDLRREAPGPVPAEDAREACSHPSVARGEPHARSGGGRLTLEEHLGRTWEGLLAAGAAECPVCREGLERVGHGGACRGCGSVLL